MEVVHTNRRFISTGQKPFVGVLADEEDRLLSCFRKENDKVYSNFRVIKESLSGLFTEVSTIIVDEWISPGKRAT